MFHIIWQNIIANEFFEKNVSQLSNRTDNPELDMNFILLKILVTLTVFCFHFL